MKNRAGHFIKQPSGYRSFVPAKLPPNPPVVFDQDMISKLSSADSHLGRLDGITQTLPDPDLFVAMYVKKEAVLSSQIEGTQASLSDLLGADAIAEKRDDIQDVIHYVRAMSYGLDRLESFPMSLRLIREIHAVLLASGRGSDKTPGEFRISQNWIGPHGCTLQNATYVPPTVPDMKTALGDLELYFYEDDNLPPLIKTALIHAQFESIHPFLDGNGRMGRLLITFWLCQQKVLSQPLLYLSYYFKLHRAEYYDSLMGVRINGDWESWIKFFLTGVAYVAEEATNSAKRIIELKSSCEALLAEKKGSYKDVLNVLFEQPFITKAVAASKAGISYPTASKIIDFLESHGIVENIDRGKARNRRYRFVKYMEILNHGTEL